MAENWWGNDPVVGAPMTAAQAPTVSTAPDWYSADPVAAGETPNRGFWGDLNQRAGSLASGFNRDFVASTLGAPGDVTAWLGNQGVRGINALTGSQIAPVTRPVLGSARIGDFIAGTVGETKPQDALDKILYSTGGALGQAIGGMGIGSGLQALGRAPRLAEALLGGPSLTPSVAASNLSIGGAAGAGSAGGGLLSDYATGSDPTARALAEQAGGLAAGVPVGLLPAAYRAGSALVRPFTESGRELLAGQELLRSAGGPAPVLPTLSDTTPLDLNYTLGQRTNDPGLLSFERSLEMGATPAQKGIYEANRTSNNQQILGAMDQIGAVGDAAEHSQYLAGSLDTAHEQARKGVTDAYAAIPGATVDMQPLKDNFTDYVSGLSKARRQFVPDNYESLLMGYDDTEPMREVMDLRSTLLAEERRARSGPQPDYNRADVLRGLDKALFEHIPEGGAPAVTTPDQAATLAYQNANALNVDYNATFNAGPMRKVFQGRGFDAAVPDSQVAQTLLGSGPGQTERVAQFVKAASMNPDAMQNARDWFASQLSTKVAGARQDATGDPFVLAATMRKFVQDNQPLINSPVFSPQQRDLIGKIVDAVAMQERTARAGARGGSDTGMNLAGGRYIDKVVGGWLGPLIEKGAGAAGAAAGAALGGGSPVAAAAGYGVGNALASGVTQNARVADELLNLLHAATRNPDLGMRLMRQANNANNAFVGPQLGQILARSAAASGQRLPP